MMIPTSNWLLPTGKQSQKNDEDDDQNYDHDHVADHDKGGDDDDRYSYIRSSSPLKTLTVMI